MLALRAKKLHFLWRTDRNHTFKVDKLSQKFYITTNPRTKQVEPMTKTFLYARVSSEEQKKDGFSLPKQRKKLEAYARKNKIKIDEIIEVDESAKTGGTRKVFNQIMDEIQENEDKDFIILCEKVDRLQRNLEDAQVIDSLVKEGKVAIHFSDETPHVYDRSANSHTKLMVGFKTLLAKFYIDLLREESMKGVDERASRGDYHTLAPLGYRNNILLKIIEYDDEEVGQNGETRAELVKEMFKLYASGKYDLRKLTKVMNQRGLTSRKGNPVSKSCIATALRNPFYYGYFMHPRERKLIKGNHAPLITKALWDRVKEVREGKAFYKHSRRLYAYSGIIKCGYCGCSVIGEPKKKLIKSTGKEKEYIYYHCSFGSKELGRKCPLPWYPEEMLKENFLEAMDMLGLMKWQIEVIREEIGLSMEEEKKFVDAERKRLQIEYTRNENMMRKMYEDKVKGDIPTDWFRKEFDKIKERQEEIREEQRELEEQNEEFIEQGLQTIELCKDIKNQYLSLDVEGKNKLLKNLYRTVILTKESFEYAWNPGWDAWAVYTKLQRNGKWHPWPDSNRRHTD